MSFSDYDELVEEGQEVAAIRARFDQDRAALEEGGKALVRAKDAVFESEGPGWEPLDDDYARRRGSAHPILKISGSYRDSFQPVYTSDSVALASDDWRFAILNDGAGGRVTARPVVIPESLIRGACRDIAQRLIGGGG